MIRSISPTRPPERRARGALLAYGCRAVGLIIVSLMVTITVACSGGTATSPTTTTTTVPAENVIEIAARACNARTSLRDKGDTIVLDTEGDEDGGGDPYSKVACVISALEMPDRIVSAIDTTRGLDGTLDDSWDGLNAQWKYHPDDGLHLTIWIDEG